MTEKTGKLKKITRMRIIAYAVVVALLISIVYLTPRMSDAFDKTATIEYGNLRISDEITCYIVRDELVLYAGENGKAGYYFDEEQLARKGAQILTVEPSADEGAGGADNDDYRKRVSELLEGDALLNPKSGHIDETVSTMNKVRAAVSEKKPVMAKMIDFQMERVEELGNGSDSAIMSTLKGDSTETDITVSGVQGDYVSGFAGFVSYELDGFETAFSPYTMKLLDQEKVTSQKYKSRSVCDGKAVKGEPLCKLINNDKWYAVTWVAPADLGKYEEDRSVKISTPKGDISGKVASIVDNGDNVMVIMEFTEFFDGIASIRKMTTELTTSDYSGLVVNNEFIASEDGIPGVYVMDITGKPVFTPVKIRATDGENSLVATGSITIKDGGKSRTVETVSVYDEIQKP